MVLVDFGNVFSDKVAGYSGMNIQVFWRFFMGFDYKYDSFYALENLNQISLY